MCLTENQSFS